MTTLQCHQSQQTPEIVKIIYELILFPELVVNRTVTAEIEGETVSRPYTPISKREQKGYVDFVIKAYPPRTDGKPGGMGRHLCALQVLFVAHPSAPRSRVPRGACVLRGSGRTKNPDYQPTTVRFGCCNPRTGWRQRRHEGAMEKI